MRKFLLAVMGALAAAASFGAQQIIPIGSPNSGNGETLYGAFNQVNANFTDLYSYLYAPITGPVTIAPGTNTSAVGTGVITNGMRATMPALTIKCNFLSSIGPELDCTAAQITTYFGFGGGGGSSVFSAITSGTNTTAAMVVGTGASLTASGSGVIAATTMPTSGLSGTILAAEFPALTGDVTTPGGSLATTVAQVNGAAVPVSAAAIASNSSSQLVAASVTGSGAVVLSTSPALVTPTLGTASATALTVTGISGTTQCVHASPAGLLSGTGSDCGAGGGGTTTTPFTIVTTNTTLTTGETAVLVNATSGNVTITLPTAASSNYEYTIKRIDSSANTVTVATTSAQTIDGATTQVIVGQYNSMTVKADNSGSPNWWII